MDAVIRYFGALSADQIEKIRLYGTLIADWNTRVNLVSRKDIENFLPKHIVQCLCISKIVRFTPGTSVIDVGTGGGLPGIPLAIVNDGVNFTLIDSIGKKVLAVGDMVKKLALKHVRVRNARVEDVDEQFDYVVARAVTNLSNFLKNIAGICGKGTRIFYIGGGDFGGELQKIGNCTVHNMGALLGDGKFADKAIVEVCNG
jgi:16S rRNA (guanine527-N7)-methyltransferase